MGNIDNSKALLPIGISGDPGSKSFKDEMNLRVTGGMRAAILDASLMEAVAVSEEITPFLAVGNPIRYRRN